MLTSGGSIALLAFALGGYFALLFNELRVDWSINPQYHYGWAVPLLALASLHMRWPVRPTAGNTALRPAIVALLALALVSLLPIRLAEEANPEWRLAMWAHAFQTILVALCLVYFAGGMPWVKHFAFPICFIL